MWLLWALLPLLLRWRHYFLATEWPVVVFLPAWQRLGCYVQDLLVWSLMFAVLMPRMTDGRRAGAWRIATAIACNVALAIQMVDFQCKMVFLQPLTWHLAIASLREADKLYSSVSVFATPNFALRFAASVLALNAAPALGLAWVWASRRVPSLARMKWPSRPATRLAVGAVPLLGLTAFLLPMQPYQIDGNVVSGRMLATARRLRRPLRLDLAARCDEPARAPEKPTVQASAWTGLARGRNVVMFIVETLPYAESSLGDPADDRTPLLRELAAYGPIATRARAQVPYSTKAIYGLLTGRYASPSIEVLESEASRLDSLPRTLKKSGYYTAFFSTQFLSWHHTGHQYEAMGFDSVVGGDDLQSAALAQGRTLRANSWGVDDREFVDGRLLDRLPRDRPFFAVFYNTASHNPYVYDARDRVGTDEARFQKALRYGDEALRGVVDGLKAKGLFDNTVLVMLGDHGEQFDGGRLQVRGCFLSERSVVVPLVIAVPGATFPRLDAPTARQIDVGPTLIDLLGLQPDTPVQGRSILARTDPEGSYLNGYGACEIYGLVEGSAKVLYDGETGEARSFALGRDPAEEHGTILADGAAKSALVERMQSCAQYDERALR